MFMQMPGFANIPGAPRPMPGAAMAGPSMPVRNSSPTPSPSFSPSPAPTPAATPASTPTVSSSPSPSPPVSATPNVPEPVESSSSEGIKIADPDIILFEQDSVPLEVMTDLIFEDIGGTEILNIARTDLVNGQSVIYAPIKNLAQIYLKYNPQNILSVQETTGEIFNNFSIKLTRHIPYVGNGPNGRNVYMDPVTGDIVIDVINLKRDERVEIQTANTGMTFNDTIYIEES